MKLKVTRRAIKLSEQYLEGFKELDKRGWEPDIIISHSGWGCGAYAKHHWPNSYMISYLEWWFSPSSTTYTYDKTNSNLGLNLKASTSHWLKNSLTALELSAADKIVSPTEWQRSQLPKIFKQNCSVIFDGIDTNKYNHLNTGSNLEAKSQLVVTYGTRGMEPLRCFPQFIESLPELIGTFPALTIEIAGNDEINYGGNSPKEGSWKNWAVNYLKNHNCDKKIKWIGRLTEPNYIKWLKSSDCHVYLTHPYVVSWSLVEAIYCCKAIVASDVEPVREFYNQMNMILVDHRQIDLITKGIASALQTPHKRMPDDRNIMDRTSIGTCLNGWETVTGLNVTTLD